MPSKPPAKKSKSPGLLKYMSFVRDENGKPRMAPPSDAVFDAKVLLMQMSMTAEKVEVEKHKDILRQFDRALLIECIQDCEAWDIPCRMLKERLEALTP